MERKSLHTAAKPRSLASISLLLACLLSIGACTTTGLGNLAGSGERRAERLAEDGRHNEAAGEYIYLASDALGDERTRLTLLAVEQWLDAGDVNRAVNATASLERPTTPELLALWQTNDAALALYRGDPDKALQQLEPLSRQPQSTRARLRIEALRADAHIQKGEPARAVEIMSLREAWIDSRRGVERSRDRLWQGLLYSRPQDLRAAAEAALDSETRGWLSLGSLAASTGQQGIGWSNGIARWRELNPSHPALTIIGDIRQSSVAAADYPRQIALILPLSGRYGENGKAIQNGFMGAYLATSGALEEHQSLRIYDVNREGGASAAYQAAVADGADFVVGPLLRSNVSELANDILVPVPVLTLNYLADDALAPPGLYQFALSPEDEAMSVAQRAIDSDGYSRAVALVPNNAWGRRVLESFTTEFEGLGGRLLDYRVYPVGKQDFSTEIETLLGLSGSVQRYRRLRANIGSYALQFDPRRRQDAEFVFLAADVGHGRLLKSQLKFHYAGDLPVYSTSTVNVRDGRSNSDLNGIMFTDVPWLIDPQPWIQYLPATYDKYWPRQRSRLHAMGFDAYNLIASLYGSAGAPMTELDGATGRLFLDQYGRVHRRLSWAQFQGGEAVALPREDGQGGPIMDHSDDNEIVAPDAADEAPWDPAPQ